jgi:hypothetical protein
MDKPVFVIVDDKVLVYEDDGITVYSKADWEKLQAMKKKETDDAIS